MRADGIFIAIEVEDGAAADSEVATRLEEACPVDIFAAGEQGLAIVQESLDECVLCRLCLEAAPGAVSVLKLYDAGAVLA